VAEAVGVPPDVVARVTAAYRGGHLDEAQAAAERVPEELVQKFVLAGTPEEARELVHKIADSGVRRLEIFALGPDRHHVARTLGERVIPAFR
jgi:alkanesulfonate monooxygenase SsuD/methylene tetrahydromethanopterin reductase-like flavin-dependent oxidoreductase (luciferase family)